MTALFVRGPYLTLAQLMLVIKMTADLMRAFADMLRAVAWPVFAVSAVFLFRREVSSLLGRLREGGGAKFDPLPQSRGSEALSTEAILASIPFPRTDAVITMEQNIVNHPVIVAIREPARREQAFLTLAARSLLGIDSRKRT